MADGMVREVKQTGDGRWRVLPDAAHITCVAETDAVMLRSLLEEHEEFRADTNEMAGELLLALVGILPMAEAYCRGVAPYVDPMVKYRHSLLLEAAYKATNINSPFKPQGASDGKVKA